MTKHTLKSIEKITGKLTLGKLLWAIRQADGIPQVDFAAKLDISKQHLCDIEHDRKIVSPRLAARYADILGYSAAQFIRLALQALVDQQGLNVQIEVFVRKSNKIQDDLRDAA